MNLNIKSTWMSISELVRMSMEEIFQSSARKHETVKVYGQECDEKRCARKLRELTTFPA
jgi:hypothetical protein